MNRQAKKPDIRFTLRLPPELYRAVGAVADRENRSINGQVVQLLSEALAASNRRLK